MNAGADSGAIPTLRLTRIFVGLRFRLLRNVFRRRRARGTGPGLTLPLAMGLLTSVAYVGLFAQSFGVVVATTDLAGQRAVLALVVGVIAFGTLAAKTASSDAVLAGTPENEFLLTRPTSLPSLVIARSLAEALTDPFGALFLFPVLVAAALTWDLPPIALAAAAATSMLAQIAISATAQAAQIALVRYTPARRRRLLWMVLRLLASLTLAVLWMTGTSILRDPRGLAAAVGRWRAVITWTPGAALVAPLLGVRLGHPLGALAAVAALGVATAGLLALAYAVARRAGLHGWEEAGASWAEAHPQRAPVARRPLTVASKDLRLIVRDRTQLLALIAAPLIFVGVQVFGAAGWTWSTASLTRVAVLVFSLTLYMATLGPLAHMQAERRSFWILRTAPIPIGRLMLVKARAWALVLASLAGVAFLVLSAGVAGASLVDRLALAAWVAVGAAGMAFIAVALACQSADLSDDARPALGPATIYLFLLVGALYNVVLAEDGVARWRWLAMYLFVAGALWSSGMAQADECLDPEVHRRRVVRLGDAAVLVLLSALASRTIEQGAKLIGSESDATRLLADEIVHILLGTAAGIYLWRRRRGGVRRGTLAAIGIGVLAGVGLGFLSRAWQITTPASLPASLPTLLSQELILRGCLQRALQDHLGGRHGARVYAAAVTVAVTGLAFAGSTPLGLAGHATASLVWAVTARQEDGRGAGFAPGRVLTSFLTRAVATYLPLVLG